MATCVLRDLVWLVLGQGLAREERVTDVEEVAGGVLLRCQRAGLGDQAQRRARFHFTRKQLWGWAGPTDQAGRVKALS